MQTIKWLIKTDRTSCVVLTLVWIKFRKGRERRKISREQECQFIIPGMRPGQDIKTHSPLTCDNHSCKTWEHHVPLCNGIYAVEHTWTCPLIEVDNISLYRSAMNTSAVEVMIIVTRASMNPYREQLEHLKCSLLFWSWINVILTPVICINERLCSHKMKNILLEWRHPRSTLYKQSCYDYVKG